MNALRRECLDLPECQSRGAWKVTPEAICRHTVLPTHAQKLICACPSTSHEVHLQCFYANELASIEAVKAELTRLGAPPTYLRVTQVMGDARAVISVVHAVISSELANSMWDQYLASQTSLVIQHLGKEAVSNIPTRHQTACLETPLEHWQRYSNEHEAPITRLAFMLPAVRADKAALERFAYTTKASVWGCECLWTQEDVPILHITVEGKSREEYATLIRRALLQYSRDVGVDKGEGPAAEVFGRPRDVRFLTDEQEHLEGVSGYAVYVVTGKDNLRMPMFQHKSRAVRAAFHSMLNLANFGRSILVAPYRHDFRHVYGQSSTLRLEVFCHIGSHAAQVPEHREAILSHPVPESRYDTSHTAATLPPKSGRPIEYDTGEAAATRKAKLANVVQNKLKQHKECQGVDTKPDEDVYAPQVGEIPHACPTRAESHVATLTRDSTDVGSAKKHTVPA